MIAAEALETRSRTKATLDTFEFLMLTSALTFVLISALTFRSLVDNILISISGGYC